MNENTPQEPEKKPDDTAGINVEGFVKIIDPDTGEIVLATRG